MTSHPSFRFLALALLAATVLVGAFVGYHTGGFAEKNPSSPEVSASALSQAKSATAALGSSPDSLQDSLRRFLSQNDPAALDRFLPRGVGDVTGMGGRGLQRQVRSHGIWFPVFNLSKIASLDSVDPAAVSLTDIPLMITNPQPQPGRVHEVMLHRFTAVGGTPPYEWSMQLQGEAPGFTLNAATGDLTGQSETELSLPMNVFVTDATGGTASATTTLSIASAEPLTLLTSALPSGTLGQPYAVTLLAEGGAKPYSWSLDTTSPGWLCDPATGRLSAAFTEPGAHDLRITVSDLTTSVSSLFQVRVTEGLEITTESPLPPAAPGGSYSGRFEAVGGVAPYTWTLASGRLPSGWELLPDGEMAGPTPEAEARHQFTILVTDSGGLTYRKPFEVSIRQGLIAVPSREKAGLAWDYADMAAALGSPIAGVSLTRNGAEIYRGAGSNVVDRGLATGASYSYELTAFTADGRAVPYASKVVKILPITPQRAQPGLTGDPYADRVRLFAPLSAGGYGSANVPFNVLGPPDGASTFTPAYLPQHVLSLHSSPAAGGTIVLEFTDNIIESGPGQDFTVFENVIFRNNDPNQRFMEPAIVEVALFEDQWHRFPCLVSPPAEGEINFKQPSYYTQGFAGINATTGEDPANPARSGGDSFDLAATGAGQLRWIRFIRLRATGDNVLLDTAGTPVRHTSENTALSGYGSSGFDLDAVTAVND